MQIWTALAMLDTDLQVAERAGNKKWNMADDFNGIVQQILSRRRTKLITWCRERSTPFIMGMKLFVLVMLEPFVLDKISSAREKRRGSANSNPPCPAAPARPLPVGQGEGVRKEQKHPIVKLKDSYVGFAGVLPLVLQDVGESWEAVAVQAVMEFSPLKHSSTLWYCRRELFASWGEAWHKFNARIQNYPSLFAEVPVEDDAAVGVALDKFVKEDSCCLEAHTSRPAQEHLLNLSPGRQRRSFKLLCRTWSAPQKAATVQEENWHAWQHRQNTTGKLAPAKVTQSANSMAEQIRRIHQQRCTKHGLCSQRPAMVKRDLKKLAKGKLHAIKPRRGKPIGGYHIFARRIRGECSGTGVTGLQRLQQINAAWKAADARTKMECENEALKERVDCIWGKEADLKKRDSFAAKTPWRVGDSESPVRVAKLEDYFKLHGRQKGMGVFAKGYSDVLGHKHIQSNMTVKQAARAEAAKHNKEMAPSCSEKHLGLCREKDKDTFIDAVRAGKAISAALDAVFADEAAAVADRRAARGVDGVHHNLLQEEEEEEVPFDELGVLIRLYRVHNEQTQVVHAVVAYRCGNPPVDVLVPHRIVSGCGVQFAPGPSDYSYVVETTNIAELKPKLAPNFEKYHAKDCVVFMTMFSLAKLLAIGGEACAWHVQSVNYECLSLLEIQAGCANDMGVLSALVPQSLRSKPSGKGKGKGKKDAAAPDPAGDEFDQAMALWQPPKAKRARRAAAESVPAASAAASAAASDAPAPGGDDVEEWLADVVDQDKGSEGGSVDDLDLADLVAPPEGSGPGGEAEVEEEEEPLPMLRGQKFFFRDETVAGHFSAWPAETLRNQRVQCKLHRKCSQVCAVPRLPCEDAWAKWLLLGRRVGTAEAHKALWSSLASD